MPAKKTAQRPPRKSVTPDDMRKFCANLPQSEYQALSTWCARNGLTMTDAVLWVFTGVLAGDLEPAQPPKATPRKAATPVTKRMLTANLPEELFIDIGTWCLRNRLSKTDIVRWLIRGVKAGDLHPQKVG